MMLPFLSVALFCIVMATAIAAIVATVKSEMPYITRALGTVPAPLPTLRPARAQRIRVIHPLRLAERPSLRVAA